MIHRGHFIGGRGLTPNFGIIVDDETMTWTTDPPGQTIERALIGFPTSHGGPVGSGKRFDILPGGKAQLSR